jgi:hypothetical protein
MDRLMECGPCAWEGVSNIIYPPASMVSWGCVLICPQCYGECCHRSRRRSLKYYVIGITGLRRWRCSNCSGRFYARSVALQFALRVHCRRCGRFELQRISRKYMKGFTARLWNLFRVPVYRCEPCRNRFFSALPYRPIYALKVNNQSDPGSRPKSSAASA